LLITTCIEMQCTLPLRFMSDSLFIEIFYNKLLH